MHTIYIYEGKHIYKRILNRERGVALSLCDTVQFHHTNTLAFCWVLPALPSPRRGARIFCGPMKGGQMAQRKAPK